MHKLFLISKQLRCVPEATTISLWLNIFLIFDGETWAYFMLTFMLVGTGFYYFYRFSRRIENWCYCTAAGFFITISIPIPLNPSHPLLRLYLLICCIYGLLMTSTFNSFFMSTITKPAKYAQISTKQDLINNPMEFYAENQTMSLYSDTDEVMNRNQ